MDCSLKVFVKVQEIEVVRGNGKAERVPIRAGEIDLCALSKDFFGVLNKVLSPSWAKDDHFGRLSFLLDEKSSTHRVETMTGSKVCDLRVPPGPSAGLRFEVVGRSEIEVQTPRKVAYGFEESDALHMLGTGDCQLQHPVGHFDLIELAP